MSPARPGSLATVDRLLNNRPGGSHDVMDSLAGVVARRDNLG